MVIKSNKSSIIQEGIRLREYQQLCVDGIRDAYQEGAKRVLLVLPTGGGKTYTFCYMADKSAFRQKNVLILAHRKELISQASLSLASLGIKHSLVCPKKDQKIIIKKQIEKFGESFIDESSIIRVGSIQTVARRLDALGPIDFFVFDEAHHSTSGQWKTLFDAYPDSYFLGVTATPCRLDGAALGQYYQKMVLGPSMKELVDLGFLVPPKMYCPEEIFDSSKLKFGKNGNATSASIEKEWKPQVVGNVIKEWEEKAYLKKTVIFTPSVKSAYDTAKMFCERGYDFRVLEGGTPADDRERIITDLAAGKIQGIVSCDVVSEGFDLPGLEACILMRPTESLSLFIQQVGRVLRSAPGKTHGIVIDMVGNLKFGSPLWPRDWTLEGKMKKIRIEDFDDFHISICKSCLSFFEKGKVCPFCGSEAKPVERKLKKKKGVLKEVTEEELAAQQEEKFRKKKEIWDAKTYSDLLKIEQDRGYKRGWAMIRWRTKKK